MTRGCFAPQATRFNASGVPEIRNTGLQVAVPAVRLFVQDATFGSSSGSNLMFPFVFDSDSDSDSDSDACGHGSASVREISPDVLSRVIFGTRVSLTVGVAGMLTAMLIGVVVGVIAGFHGGKLDLLLMRFTEMT